LTNYGLIVKIKSYKAILFKKKYIFAVVNFNEPRI